MFSVTWSEGDVVWLESFKVLLFVLSFVCFMYGIPLFSCLLYIFTSFATILCNRVFSSHRATSSVHFNAFSWMESADVSPSSARHDAANVKDQTGEASQSQPMSPPYWQHQYRRDSYVSVKNDSDSAPITLEDHTEEPSELSVSLWAKTVSIENHVIISGNVPGISDYVTWICKVETLDVSRAISKSNSQFG